MAFSLTTLNGYFWRTPGWEPLLYMMPHIYEFLKFYLGILITVFLFHKKFGDSLLNVTPINANDSFMRDLLKTGSRTLIDEAQAR